MLRYDGGKTGKSMAMLLKTMVNEGIFSVVLVGTEEMLGLFRSKELKSRTVADEDATLRPERGARPTQCRSNPGLWPPSPKNGNIRGVR